MVALSSPLQQHRGVLRKPRAGSAPAAGAGSSPDGCTSPGSCCPAGIFPKGCRETQQLLQQFWPLLHRVFKCQREAPGSAHPWIAPAQPVALGKPYKTTATPASP